MQFTLVVIATARGGKKHGITRENSSLAAVLPVAGGLLGS
jgi:hypothetical protein